MTLGRALRRLSLLLLTIVIAGCGAAWMVDLSPGSDIDARVLDSRLSDSSVDQLLEGRGSITKWLGAVMQGDLGESIAYSRPVSGLIAERLPLTAGLVWRGLALAWAAAALALASSLLGASRALDSVFAAVDGLLLSVPSALLALVCLFADWPPETAVAAIVFPWLHRYLASLAANERGRPHVMAAQSRGIGPVGVASRHILLPMAPTAITTLGISVTMALGAAVPVEVLCDVAGIGQLVWEAALSRDLPVLVVLTLLVATTTVLANFFADVGGALAEPQA